MMELTKRPEIFDKTVPISNTVIQLNHVKGESVFITDPEGSTIEIKNLEDGRKIVYTRDEEGRGIAIEERQNGTKLYHISKDSTGLPSSHEIRPDHTEIVYFYSAKGNLQHFVELKPNGDRVSTVIGENGSIFSMEQKQIGGVVFNGWIRNNNDLKEGMIWLHPDGQLSTFGDKSVIKQLFSRFPKFLDGVCS